MRKEEVAVSTLETKINAAKKDMVIHIKEAFRKGKTVKGNFPTSKIIEVIKGRKLEILEAEQIYQLFSQAFDEALAS